MIEKIAPIEYKEKLCFKCLKEKDDIHNYELSGRGYGSIFDGFATILQLCEECDDKSMKSWMDEIPKCEGYGEEYNHEYEISDFVKTLPIQGQELFDNSCPMGWNAHSIDSQDWIDIQLKVAPDDVYKKHGFYSPSEKQAYHNRFPTCKHTYLKIYADKSSATYCNKKSGVSGNTDGSCNPNISSGCYYCNSYEKRDFDESMIIKEVLKINPKEIIMLEYFCPRCGCKNLLHKSKVIHDYKEIDCCDNCGQECKIDIESFGE